MEKQTLFTSQQLEEIFAQIKIGGKHGSNALYRGLVEDAVALGADMGIEREDAIRVFNAAFPTLIKGILTDRITVDTLEDIYRTGLSQKYQSVASQMKAVYATRTNISSHKGTDSTYYTESYMFVLNHLYQLAQDAEIMKKYNISKQDINVLQLYYSPSQNRLAKVAEAYNISLNDAKHLVVAAKSKINAVNEADFITGNVKIAK